MKIKDICMSERPRERLIADGPSGLSNSELLAIILRSGTATRNVLDLSKDIIQSCDGRLAILSRMSLRELCGISGIGPNKASVLLAAFELGRRFMDESADRTIPLTSSRMVYDLMLPKLKGIDHEECHVICLTAAHRICGIHLIGRGTEDAVLFDPKDAMKRAFEDGARAIILTHNHPGGNPLPSSADIDKTNTLSKACFACELDMLDHIIICDDRYYSFSEDKVSSKS